VQKSTFDCGYVFWYLCIDQKKANKDERKKKMQIGIRMWFVTCTCARLT